MSTLFTLTQVMIMIVFPNAKINLGLHITEKRPDGYHNLETVFYPIPLTDALEITEVKDVAAGEPKYRLHISGAEVAGRPEDNLVTKAYLLLDREFNLPPVDIYLHKHIPSGAGLGGGSADAAFMLTMLNQRFELQLSDEQLEVHAATLGADCAFFVKNSPTFAEGIGNIFSPISVSLKGYRILVIKPDVFVSTRDAFAQIRPHRPECSLREVIARPVEQWKEALVNDFEASVFPQFPVIGEIKEAMYRGGAVYASMSGSGSSVFGLFRADAALPDLSGEGRFCFDALL